MLVSGGIAVRISSLPSWAQHVSAVFPGRYAVDALQACMNAKGLRSTDFDLAALSLTGLGAGIAGAAMFRWDPGQRLSMRGGKSWAAMALVAWLVTGAITESRGRVAASVPSAPVSSTAYFKPPAPQPPVPVAAAPVAAAPASKTDDVLPDPAPWQDVTIAHIDQIAFERLPPDSGVSARLHRLPLCPIFWNWKPSRDSSRPSCCSGCRTITRSTT